MTLVTRSRWTLSDTTSESGYLCTNRSIYTNATTKHDGLQLVYLYILSTYFSRLIAGARTPSNMRKLFPYPPPSLLNRSFRATSFSSTYDTMLRTRGAVDGSEWLGSVSRGWRSCASPPVNIYRSILWRRSHFLPLEMLIWEEGYDFSILSTIEESGIDTWRLIMPFLSNRTK